MILRKLAVVTAAAVFAAVELSGKTDADAVAAAQAESPLWFSDYGSPNAPPQWNGLNPVHPFDGPNWTLYVAANGLLCISDANGVTSSPYPTHGAAFRGPLNLAYSVFSNSSGGSQTVMFAAPASGSPQPLKAIVLGPPHVPLDDFGNPDGAEVTGSAVDAGNLEADGTNEVVVVNAGPGPSSALTVVSVGRGAVLTTYPFGPEYTDGLTVAVANLDGVGYEEILVGQRGGSRLRIYRILQDDFVLLGDGQPLGPDHHNGINVHAFDLNNDGGEDVIVTPSKGPGPARGYGFKVTDNESPRPTSRLYFAYDFFAGARTDGVRLSSGVHGDRVFIAATSGERVRFFTPDPANQTFTQTHESMMFGRNPTEINVLMVPPAAARRP